MPDSFHCLRCGNVTEVTAWPPKCRHCGGGAGTVTSHTPSRHGEKHNGEAKTGTHDHLRRPKENSH